MAEVSDSELLDQFVCRESQEAFAELVRRYVALVYSVSLRHTEDVHHAQEITQAVFIVLARKAATLRGRRVLAGWLYHTARLTAANFQRAEHRRIRREQEAYMESTLNETPPDRVWAELAPLLDEAMARLAAADRDALVLRYFENKSLEEVGMVLGVAERAAQKRVSRALERLRGIFVRRGVTVSADAIATAVSAHSMAIVPVGLVVTISGTVASGSALSASTLTLAKGVLQIMAWSKAKSAAVVGVILILGIGTTAVTYKLIHRSRQARMPDISGVWEGTVNIPQAKAKLRLVFHFAKTNGAYAATMDSVDQGVAGFPVPQVDYQYPVLRMELKAIGGTFNGEVKTNDGTISGVWNQGPVHTPMVLKYTDEPSTLATALTEADYTPRAGSDVQGLWAGTLKVGEVELQLNFKIAEAPDGTLQVRMDSVSQGANNIAASGASYQKPVLRIDFAALNGKFEGQPNASHDEIAGTWSQAGKSLPLTLKRTEAAATPPAATASYQYASEDEIQGHWKGALDIKTTKLRLVFNIGKLEDGNYVADMVSIDQGGIKIPASTTEWSAPLVQMEWKGFNGNFTGKLHDGKLTGKWRQGNLTLPLELERSATE